MEYYDPWVSEYRDRGRTVKGLPAIDEAVIAQYDLVMITAAHTNVDYEMVQRSARAVFDTKNVMKNLSCRDNIEIL